MFHVKHFSILSIPALTSEDVFHVKRIAVGGNPLIDRKLSTVSCETLGHDLHSNLALISQMGSHILTRNT